MPHTFKWKPQLNQDQAGASQILHTKLFQMQVIRKLLVMVSILLLFPFYSSSSLISFSKSMSFFYHISPPSLFSIFPSPYSPFCSLCYSSSSTSLILSSSLLPFLSIVHCSFSSLVYYSQSAPSLSSSCTFLFWRAQLSVRCLEGITLRLNLTECHRIML